MCGSCMAFLLSGYQCVRNELFFWSESFFDVSEIFFSKKQIKTLEKKFTCIRAIIGTSFILNNFHVKL